MLSKAPRYRGDISACASSRYQAHFPSGKCGLGSRLSTTKLFEHMQALDCHCCIKNFHSTIQFVLHKILTLTLAPSVPENTPDAISQSKNKHFWGAYLKIPLDGCVPKRTDIQLAPLEMFCMKACIILYM